MWRLLQKLPLVLALVLSATVSHACTLPSVVAPAPHQTSSEMQGHAGHCADMPAQAMAECEFEIGGADCTPALDIAVPVSELDIPIPNAAFVLVRERTDARGRIPTPPDVARETPITLHIVQRV